MVELDDGKAPSLKVKGWHDLYLVVSHNDKRLIQGPIDPETSEQIRLALES